MSFEEYQKNLRGVNDGSSFSPEFLVRYELTFKSFAFLTKMISSNTYMIRYESVKLLCQKNTPDS